MDKGFEVKDSPKVGGKGLFVHHKYKGTFQYNEAVIEYVGERINKKEYKRRLKEYGTDGTFNYMAPAGMKGWYIDATKKGNWARYVNHSCDPNCGLEDATVNGERTVMLVCYKSMSAGMEVTIDYGKNYRSVDGKYIRCLCKVSKCSGIIGVTKKELPEILMKWQDMIPVPKALPAPAPIQEKVDQVIEEEVVVENVMEYEPAHVSALADDHSYSANDPVVLLVKVQQDEAANGDTAVSKETTAPVVEAEHQTGFDKDSFLRLMEENQQLRMSLSRVSMQSAQIAQLLSQMQMQSVANSDPSYNMGILHHTMAANDQMQSLAHSYRVNPYQRVTGDGQSRVPACRGFRRNGQKVYFY
jgi:hypothetical protein